MVSSVLVGLKRVSFVCGITNHFEIICRSNVIDAIVMKSVLFWIRFRNFSATVVLFQIEHLVFLAFDTQGTQ